uniref:NF-kappa-B-activating protein C-terminal domain-containing protein n=1 Tax=Rhodosorus marinus TaxID=101924 RepID=A0A7S2ZZW9_9RHOD|mmetsp:Transcript_36656/g.146520  ORF Transcript_36656/g.146520 Transcript_36656/m.146520 type:complete len:394 (+) Transcript_36656:239-1420(+)
MVDRRRRDSRSASVSPTRNRGGRGRGRSLSDESSLERSGYRRHRRDYSRSRSRSPVRQRRSHGHYRDDRRDRYARNFDRNGRSEYRDSGRRRSPERGNRSWDKEKRWKEEDQAYKPENAGETFFEARKRERDEAKISPVWARSPLPHELLSSSDDDMSSKKKKKKTKKKKESKKEKKDKKEKKAKKERKEKREKKKKHRSSYKDDSSSLSDTSESGEEKEQVTTILAEEAAHKDPGKLPISEQASTHRDKVPVFDEAVGGESSADSEGEHYGPAAPQRQSIISSDFGKNLLPGEGSAMASFVQEGKRIPRRGEIGLKSEEIESFETAGYVMSGSRNRRMEAIRIRKENQIYSADERAALATFNYEEKQQKEKKILNEFRRLVDKKLAETDQKD